MSNKKKYRLEIMLKVRNAEWDIMSNGKLGPRLQQAQGAQQEGHGGSVAKLGGERQQQESQTFSPIQHFVPFDVLSHFVIFFHSTFFLGDVSYYSTFCPNPIDIFSIRRFVPFGVLSFDVFYRRRFLLRHFVSEPSYVRNYYKYYVKPKYICVYIFKRHLTSLIIA